MVLCRSYFHLKYLDEIALQSFKYPSPYKKRGGKYKIES